MGVDALAALVVGRAYDRIGLMSLLAVPILTMPIPFLAFSTSYSLVVIGIVLWGVVMGIQETIMRAAIADLTSVQRRGFAYGIFNTVYGAGWLLGGALMGPLYELSLSYLILFVIVMELISIRLLSSVKRAA
jgi:predicted MFS family arabinose efflux permease